MGTQSMGTKMSARKFSPQTSTRALATTFERVTFNDHQISTIALAQPKYPSLAAPTTCHAIDHQPTEDTAC
jgi:hypothetical protein